MVKIYRHYVRRHAREKRHLLQPHKIKTRPESSSFPIIREMRIIRIVETKAHKYGIYWNTENGKRGEHSS